MSATNPAPARRPPSRTPAALLACLLAGLGTLPASHAEEALGRLFFTPERRLLLDRQRQLNIQDADQVAEDPTLTINGIVTRSSGKRTAWINGVPHTEAETHDGITVTPRPRAAGKLVVRSEGAPPTEMRVGETLDRNSGTTHSPLHGGRVVPRTPAR